MPLHRPRGPVDVPGRRDNSDPGCSARDAPASALPSGSPIYPHSVGQLQLDQYDVPERLTLQRRGGIKPSHPSTIRPVPAYLRIDSSAKVINRYPESVPCSHNTRVMRSRRAVNPAEKIQDLLKGQQRHVVQARMARPREYRSLHLDQVHLGEELDLGTE